MSLLLSCTLSSSQDLMHCTLFLTVCKCTPCQRASFNSTTDSFSWGHDPYTLACKARDSSDRCWTSLSVSLSLSFTDSHGPCINACVFGRLRKSFWFHILLVKHQVDVCAGRVPELHNKSSHGAAQHSLSICSLCEHHSVLMMTWSQSCEKKVKH